jgi:HlyD family secretion protein
MRRVLPLLIVAVATALFWFRDHWLPAAADHASYLGYVEGETTLVGAGVAGRLTNVAALEGKAVSAGDVLFELDDAVAEADVARLAASVATAKSTANNLLSGKRDAEMALIGKQQAEAEANLDLARIEFNRASTLNQRGISAETQFDKAKASLAVAEARAAQVKASADVARLAARDDEIAAARSRITEADAAMAAATARLTDYQGKAPQAAVVDDVFFEAGETVSAGQAVVSLLQPDRITLRFFIPEADRAKARAGTLVRYSCDGCAGGSAKIIHVAATPEYTPPVIYSATARAKLVFLVEAKPTSSDPDLQPGLPVDVDIRP